MNRRIAINLTVFLAVFAVFLVWAARNIITIDALERPYELSADFDAAAGVLPDAEVSFLGVRYGRVASVERIPGGVRLDMKIDRGKSIPEGSTFSIFRKSAVGEPYVLVRPPDDYDGDGPFLAAGAAVPQDQTSVPLEFSEMLRSASRLISSIDPDAVGGLIHELAVGLEGRTEDLRRLTTAGDQLAASFAERSDVLDRLATNNTRLTKVIAEHRDSLFGSLSDLRQVASSLRNAHGDLRTLLSTGDDLLGQTADIVAAQKANLDCILGDLEDVTEALNTDARIAGLTTVLSHGPEGLGVLWQARDEGENGLWVRVGLMTNPTNKSSQYVPPKPLPSPPEIPVCGSLLVATGGDYVPTSAPSPLPATGRDALAVGGLLLAATVLVLRSVGSRAA